MGQRTERPSPAASDTNLRRSAFRAAKALDRLVTKDDPTLAAVERAYADGTDAELASAITALVWLARGMG